MKRRRNSRGQYISKWDANIRPLLWLMVGVAVLGLVWTYFKKSEVIGPCEGGCDFFMVRAYEEQEVPEIDHVAPQLTTKKQIFAYIVEVFGNDAGDIITMVRKCENSTFDQERGNHNTNGTYDKGILQINSVHLSGKEFPVCKDAHTDWKANIDCGKAIMDKYGLSAWSCSHVVDVTPFYLR